MTWRSSQILKESLAVSQNKFSFSKLFSNNSPFLEVVLHDSEIEM